MDIQSITQVNYKWIFSAGIHDKARPELLREIYTEARKDAAFYDRMASELAAIIDREREKLQHRHCPQIDEIEKMPLAEKCTAEVEREYYLRDSNEISGMYDVLSEVNQKRFHADKIARQARAALEG